MTKSERNYINKMLGYWSNLLNAKKAVERLYENGNISEQEKEFALRILSH